MQQKSRVGTAHHPCPRQFKWWAMPTLPGLSSVVVFGIGCFYPAGCATTKNEPIGGVGEAPVTQQAPLAEPIEAREEKYPDGTVQSRVEGYEDAEGNFIRHGLLTNFWEDGKKKLQVTYVHDLLQGPRTAWYQNGQLRSQGTYVEGRSHGTWTVWFPRGQKAQEYLFDHGAWHGMSTHWHANGQKKMQVEYVRGEKQGLLTVWDEQGKIVRQVEYVNDVEQP